MQTQESLKGLKLGAILMVAVVGFLAHVARSDGAQGQPARLFEIAGMNMPLAERVGIDDGAAFVVHFAGDTRGSLDVCG